MTRTKAAIVISLSIVAIVIGSKIHINKTPTPLPLPWHPEVVDKSKTWCFMQCGDVPFAGFKCFMVCATCTTEWGGGCQITIYPPN